MKRDFIFASSSWNFFRRLKKKKTRTHLIVCALSICILNLNGIDFFIDEIRLCMIQMRISAHYAFKNLMNKTDRILYIISNDIDKALMDLHIENTKLKIELDLLAKLKLENDELRKLLTMKTAANCSVAVAKIIDVSSNDYTRSCILDVGLLEGVAIDDIVMTNAGLVGRISEVYEKWSQVLLITDANSSIPVKIGKAQVNAIVSGDNSDILRISMKHEDININYDDIVETSGYGKVFCDKIPVGKVAEKNGIFVIIPHVNFNALTYVSILKKK